MLLIERYADLHRAPDEAVWTQAFFAHARRLGFAHCLFATLPHYRSPMAQVWVRSSFPTPWLERYFGRGYAEADFKVTRCMSSSTPFLWEPGAFVGPEQRRIYDEGCAFGLRAGVSLPAHGPGGAYGQLCLSNDTEPGAAFRQHVERNLPELLLLRDTLAHTCKPFASPLSLERPVSLTARELQCLRWAAKGKSSRQMSFLMGCTESTVNFHLGNARRKLRVPTRQAAVVMAIQIGQLVV